MHQHSRRRRALDDRLAKHLPRQTIGFNFQWITPIQLNQPGQSLEHQMGSGLDAAKTLSSLTLFETAGLESAGALLDRIGRRCTPTLERLSLALTAGSPTE